jgi:hypothetical protein
MRKRTIVFGTAAVGVAALIVIGAVTASPPPASHRAPATQAATSAPAAATVPAAPAPPQFTPAQQQVLDSAESYLTDGQGFSKARLMDQLTSSSGEGFSHRLARFALAHLQVNWNQQAVLSAKGYLTDGQGFSRSGLVQQLESAFGEQFTPAQARHGAAVAMRG